MHVPAKALVLLGVLVVLETALRLIDHKHRAQQSASAPSQESEGETVFDPK